MQEMINKTIFLVATEGIKEITKSIINTYIKPKLDQIYINTKEEKELDLIEYKLNEYLERSYNNNLYMNTIVFKNSQKTINDLYIPLYLKKSNLINNEEDVKICINDYKEDFISKYKKILLVDNAGMGKSTVMKYLFLSAVSKKKGIPILIELRKIDKAISIVEYIMNEINGLRENFNKEIILTLIERGDFIFLFDGYDEIKEEIKGALTEKIEDFVNKASGNDFIISSRDEPALSCFGDFQRFHIEPLKKQEAYNLLRKYDNNGELCKQLIGLLENGENLKIVQEFLDNPLMVALLYLAFGYRRDLPNGKHIFYKQVYNALFLDHDKSKGGAYVHPKKSNLNIDDFHKILRILGFITLKDGISYTREKFIEYLEIAKRKALGVEFKASDFLYDLEYIVPIFVKEGEEYKWCHKSFQEYFAACYINYDVTDKQKSILLKISDDNRIQKYYNVLDFYYDIDYKGFTNVIVLSMIDEIKDIYDNMYTDTVFLGYGQNEINFRKNINTRYKKICIKVLSDEEREYMRSAKRKGDSFNYFRETLPDEYSKSMAHIMNDEYVIYYIEDRINVLLKLLKFKGVKIFKEEDESMRNLYSPAIANMDSGIYEINDNPDNIFNNIDNFNEITKILFKSQIGFRSNQSMFDYEKCLKLRENIIQENQYNDNDLDFL